MPTNPIYSNTTVQHNNKINKSQHNKVNKHFGKLHALTNTCRDPLCHLLQKPVACCISTVLSEGSILSLMLLHSFLDALRLCKIAFNKVHVCSANRTSK